MRWALQELGVEFEAIPVDLVAGQHRSPEFVAINPAGKLPVLVDGEFVLTESVAIVLYLAEKYRTAARGPRRARGGLSLAAVRGDGAGAAAVADLAPHLALSRA